MVATMKAVGLSVGPLHIIIAHADVLQGYHTLCIGLTLAFEMSEDIIEVRLRLHLVRQVKFNLL